MPKRESQLKTAEILKEARQRALETKALEWFRDLTGRAIYEMPTLNLMNRTVIDRPVRMAVHGTTMEPETSLNPVEVMTDSMVDGFCVIRLGPGWEHLTIEPFVFIKEVRLDGKGFVEYIRIEYIYKDEDSRGYIFRREYQKLNEYDEAGYVIGEVSFIRDWPPVAREADFVKVNPGPWRVVEFIPFVVFPWFKLESFFEPIKLAILHIENVAHEISGENIRHHKRKLFVTIPSHTDKEPEDLNEEINTLTEGGTAFYPDPHAAAMSSFFREKEDNIEAIENATGVIATEKIVALSGVSRMIAMKSLSDLAKDIRNVFTKGMIRIEQIFNAADFNSGKLLINYQPIAMPVTDPLNQYELLKQAYEAGQIDEHEFREATRTMLSI